MRSTRSLIQTAGRAARNINGTVILYADQMTDSIRATLDETSRRRKIQERYNQEHHITPESIKKDIVDILERDYSNENRYIDYVADYAMKYTTNNLDQLAEVRDLLRKDMLKAADELEFEKAAVLRDQMIDIENKISLVGKVKKQK